MEEERANAAYRKLHGAMCFGTTEEKCLCILSKISPYHCHERTHCFFRAVRDCKFRVADAILDQGLEIKNVRTGDKRSLIEMQNFTDSVAYLLRRGATIPTKFLSGERSQTRFGIMITKYVYRTWTPGNHADWPVPFKKQVIALLLARARTNTAIYYLHADVFLRLVAWIACGQFVFV